MDCSKIIYSLFLSLSVFVLLVNTSCSDSHYSDVVAIKADSLPALVDYNIHIRPILSDRCFNCHGPDANKRKAGLRLDFPEPAYAKLVSGKNGLVPNDLASSEVFRRITSKDPHQLMPTPESNMSLSALEIAMLGKWIQQGAVYKPLWSLVPVKRPVIPAVKEKQWVKTPIDAFILEGLERAKVKHAGLATPAVLINRLTQDLTGLPASPQQIDDYRSGKISYDQVVAQLLASPQYGEKMAMEWVDVARYADSHGFQDDGYRNTWHWRDWVIKAFNQNMPLNQFVTWQLAGDLLPNPTQDMMIATGFNRNHPQNQEGGIVPEEYRVEYVLDRTNTIGKAFLGLTVECSRCHDHKYDPISQKEYYALSAYFNQNDEPGQIPNFGHPGPTYQLVAKADQTKLDQLKATILKLEQAYTDAQLKEEPGFRTWKNQLLNKSNPYHQILNVGLEARFSFDRIDSLKHFKPEVKPMQGGLKNNAPNAKLSGYANNMKLVNGSSGMGITPNKNDMPYFPFIGNYDRFDPFSIGGYYKVTYDNKGGVLFSNATEIYDGFNGYTAHYNADSTLTFRICNQFPANCIQITTVSHFPIEQWFHFMVTYDGSSKANGMAIYLDGKKQKVKIDYDYLTKATDKHAANNDTTPEGNKIVFDQKYRRAKVYLLLGAMRQYQYPSLKGIMDEFRVYNRNISGQEVAAIAQIDKGAQPTQLPQEDAWWKQLYYQTAPKTHKAFQLLRYAKHVWDTVYTGLPEVMVMKDRKELRKTYILDRGSYESPTTEVTMGVISSVGKIPANYPKNRLGLSQWIVSEKNPLTARVIVNRYWQLIMGKGLVRTPGDFGNQGEMPTHPELLDWLASEFIAKNWDVKYLIKLIVTSNVYRQGNNVSNKDHQNRLCSGMPRYRMSFEQIRDKALKVSGLLVEKVGGASVFPYQPPGLWEEKTSGRHLAQYRQSHGEGLYRRSMYTFFKRSSAPPTLMTFDGSDRSTCFVKKEQTNTPLQSLVALNDIQFQEAARVTAAKLLQNKRLANLDAQLTDVFSQWIGRCPQPTEMEKLTRLYNKAKANFKNAPDKANQLIRVGESPVTKGINPIEQAALAVCVLTIFNLDEGLNRN